MTDDGAPLYPTGSLPFDARDALIAMIEMSQMNCADTRFNRLDNSSPPWLIALTGLVRGASFDPGPMGPHVLPMYDGDPSEGSCPIRASQLFQRDVLHYALADRALRLQGEQRSAALRSRRVVQEMSKRVLLMTHRGVHRALVGETTGPTIPGCPCCERMVAT